MHLSKEDIKRIKNKSKHLNKAIEALKSDYEDKELIPIIKIKQPKIKSLSEGYFSKCKKVATNDEYLDQISEITLTRIIEALDSLIKDEYDMIWDRVNFKYDKLLEGSNVDNDLKEDQQLKEEQKKLSGLHGVWKSFSWNKKRSEREKIDHINVCRVKIFEDLRVIYVTEKANFKGKLKAIGHNKIAIELIAENRRAYLLGKIGVRDDLQNIHTINLAYTDSGNEEIRCGLTIMQRTGDTFESITAKSYLIDTNPPCSSEIIELLKGIQYLAKMHDD